MTMEANHVGSWSKEVLELSLQNAEATIRKILSIRVQGNETVSTHEGPPSRVPRRSLILVEDPNDNATGPAGSTPLFKGEALIGGARKKVALFRKAAAAAPAVPPAVPPGTPPPPPPAGGAA